MQKEVMCEIAEQSQKLVVMSKRAFGFLEESYGVRRDKIAFIPHGIHDTPFIDPNYYKDKFGCVDAILACARTSGRRAGPCKVF